MKKLSFYLVIIALTSISCKFDKEKELSILNPLGIERMNDILEIPYEKLTELIGEAGEGYQYLFVDQGDTLISQFIDYEKDGLTDIVLVEVSLMPNESKALSVFKIKKELYPDFPIKTNIRFAEHKNFALELAKATRLQSTTSEISSRAFLMEGPAWENDKIAFRNYFDRRNGMDIFGKLSSKIALDNVGVHDFTVGAPESLYGLSYHDLNDWGMDILKVGNSLGAGSVALYTNDSLFRLGDNGKGSFERLYEGPLRSEFKFVFPDWKAGDQEYYITQYISITAGSYAFKSSLFIRNKEEGTDFVTGLVNMHSNELKKEEITDKFDFFYTHDLQAFDTTYLTLGLVIEKDLVLQSGKTRDKGEGITQTYFIKMKTEPNTQLDYWFYALWARSNPDFEKAEFTTKTVRMEIEKMESPIQIRKK